MRSVRSFGSEVRRAARRLRNRLRDRVLVLLYHRVAELPSDPQMLAVAPDRFAQHLAIVQRQAQALRLEQLVRGVRKGHVPHRGIVITFDDGYADNLDNAAPLLEQYGIPATVF